MSIEKSCDKMAPEAVMEWPQTQWRGHADDRNLVVIKPANMGMGALETRHATAPYTAEDIAQFCAWVAESFSTSKGEGGE